MYKKISKSFKKKKGEYYIPSVSSVTHDFFKEIEKVHRNNQIKKFENVLLEIKY